MTTESHSSFGFHWVSMDPDLLRRVRRMAAILGAILAIPIANAFGIGCGAAWLAGIAWSLVNLYLIATVVRGTLAMEKRSKKELVLPLVVKFPALYVAGLALLRVEQLPALWLVAGFTWPFFVVVMKAAGRAYTGADDGDTEH